MEEAIAKFLPVEILKLRIQRARLIVWKEEGEPFGERKDNELKKTVSLRRFKPEIIYPWTLNPLWATMEEEEI